MREQIACKMVRVENVVAFPDYMFQNLETRMVGGGIESVLS
jgi:hypothetical protein